MDQNAEATHSYVRAAPGRVFARLARRTADGTLVRGMHVEFTPAQALQMARHLDECARMAIAADGPPQRQTGNSTGRPVDVLPSA
ncbi:hypothetical protein [Rhodopila sp.]|uniref:hypothetical protein n=1 Tax=Rhodopila sp. TaxID=2480087 RepID=UPI003D0C0CBA